MPKLLCRCFGIDIDENYSLLRSIIETINATILTPYIYFYISERKIYKTTFNRIIRKLSKVLEQILNKNIICDSIYIENCNQICITQNDVHDDLHEFIWDLSVDKIRYFVTENISEPKETISFDEMIDIMITNTIEYYETKIRSKIID